MEDNIFDKVHEVDRIVNVRVLSVIQWVNIIRMETARSMVHL